MTFSVHRLPRLQLRARPRLVGFCPARLRPLRPTRSVAIRVRKRKVTVAPTALTARVATAVSIATACAYQTGQPTIALTLLAVVLHPSPSAAAADMTTYTHTRRRFLHNARSLALVSTFGMGLTDLMTGSASADAQLPAGCCTRTCTKATGKCGSPCPPGACCFTCNGCYAVEGMPFCIAGAANPCQFEAFSYTCCKYNCQPG